MPSAPVAGQLNADERQIITAAILDAPKKLNVVLKVGTWLGGDSMLHFLRGLEKNGRGRLWGIEAEQSINERMLENIRHTELEATRRFTRLFGFSRNVIPEWLQPQRPDALIDLCVLDGGSNAIEQINEFKLLADRIPIGRATSCR